jgi:hypothetical protein
MGEAGGGVPGLSSFPHFERDPHGPITDLLCQDIQPNLGNDALSLLYGLTRPGGGAEAEFLNQVFRKDSSACFLFR